MLSDVIETADDSSPNGVSSPCDGGGITPVAAVAAVPDILVLQDLFTAGYHSAAHDRLDECGLDFNHR